MIKNSTIAAIATPVGSGGIGIIKISGPDSFNIASLIFRRSGRNQKNLNPISIKPQYLHHGHVVDPKTGNELDEVLVAFMKAPHSYTREDVVEIQAHAGPYSLKSIIDLVIENGAFIAEPGEFTKRAYLNGRIDLTQAEAVIDIINARSSSSLNIAAMQIKGELSDRINAIRQELIDILTRVEAVLDFPEDTEELVDIDNCLHRFEHSVIQQIKELIECYENSHFLRDGFKIVIAGGPNVGKSSLMNRLVKKDRSIVTSVPGTTRDLVEDIFNIQGIPILVTDTAGIHDASDDLVERIGISKAVDQIEKSDLVLFMMDVSLNISDIDFHKIILPIKDKTILIVNKIDLVASDHKFEFPTFLKDFPCVRLSALYNTGIDDLKDLIGKIFLTDSNTVNVSVPNIRHKKALVICLEHAVAAFESFKEKVPYELVSIDIQGAIDSLGEIIGLTARLDVLDSIFNNFCIGK